MTVATTARRATYAGDGTQTVFPWTFLIIKAAHLRVLIGSASAEVELVAGVDYTATGFGNPSGGSVTLAVPPSTGATVVLLRELPVIQQLNLRNQGPFLAEVVEAAFDSVVMIAQQIADSSDRALQLAETAATDTDLRLPAPAPGQVIAWDSSEPPKLTNLSLGDLSAVQVFGDWTYDDFAGDGLIPSFFLRRVPGSLANLDVSVDGLSQVPVVDYTVNGQIITFATPPTDGAAILVRYGSAITQTVGGWIQEHRVAAGGETAIGLTSTYAPGAGTLAVYLNGLRLIPGVDYTETDATTVTLATPMVAGDDLLVVLGDPLSADIVQASQIVDGAVTTPKIADAAVTVAKLAPGIQAQLGAIPAGAVMDFAMDTAPAGWLECDGSAVDRLPFASLFAAIGTTWGAGDGSTTFNLPDFRGEFRRGWDHGRGVDAGRDFASFQADETKAHTHTYVVSGPGSPYGGDGLDHPRSGGLPKAASSTGGAETRPRNRAVLTCIKV